MAEEKPVLFAMFGVVDRGLQHGYKIRMTNGAVVDLEQVDYGEATIMRGESLETVLFTTDESREWLSNHEDSNAPELDSDGKVSIKMGEFEFFWRFNDDGEGSAIRKSSREDKPACGCGKESTTEQQGCCST